MARKKYLGLGVGAQCFPLLKSLHPQNIIQEDFPIYAAKERGHRDQEKERSSYSSGGIFFEHLQFQGREIYCAAGMPIQLRRVIQKIFSILPLLPKLRLRLSKENHATILAQKFSKWATIGKILPQFELKASTLMTTMIRGVMEIPPLLKVSAAAHYDVQLEKQKVSLYFTFVFVNAHHTNLILMHSFDYNSGEV